MSDTTKIEGVLVEPGVEGTGASGISKAYTEEELKGAVGSLAGTLVFDEPQSSGFTTSNLIGEVTSGRYDPDRGLVFEAEIHDDDIAEKIESDLATVAPRVIHDPIEDLDTDDTVNPMNIEVDDVFTTPSATEQVGDTEVLAPEQSLSDYVSRREV